MFPANAIASDEILNEVGAASSGGNISVTIGYIPTVITSRSITVPASGYVLVMATSQVSINHNSISNSRSNFGVSDAPDSLPGNQDILVGVGIDATTAYYYIPVTVHGLFEAPSAGTFTYYFLGLKFDPGADFTAWDPQLTLIYIPTSYGTVTPTMAGTANQSEEITEFNPGMTEADIAAERAASIADNNARIQGELEKMRSELEELKRQMENSKDQIRR